MKCYSKFDYAIADIERSFTMAAYPIETEKWQGIKLPQPMREQLFVSFQVQMPEFINELQELINPNLPWADIHFQERIGGKPLNPGESYKQMRTENEKFSHTYMERLWPKQAGEIIFPNNNNTHQLSDLQKYRLTHLIFGVRYDYGDIQDVVNLLYREPLTRQAFLPIWFPEDTGAVHGGRIPCTIGYHFIMRDNKLHVIYYIRSCDLIRHWKDDMYLAVRKVQWIIAQLQQKEMNDNSPPFSWENVIPGIFTMHITSLHCFQSDMYSLNKKYANK